MKSSTQTAEHALGLLVGFCYLISLTLCVTGIYALMQLALAAAGGVASEIYPSPGLF
jgi:hypothetical protein